MTEQTIRLSGSSRGKTYSCPLGTEGKLSPHDSKAGRIKLTLRQVRQHERTIVMECPDGTAPGPGVTRYNTRGTRDKRVVSAYNTEGDTRHAIIAAACD